MSFKKIHAALTALADAKEFIITGKIDGAPCGREKAIRLIDEAVSRIKEEDKSIGEKGKV